MTELDLPLRSPALYNPHLLSREELVALFSAREALLEELLTDLRGTPANESAQHHLIVGQRGMGKTMLLRRLQCAVDDDPSLREIWLPLSFPEEQYNVVTLSDFWLNCVDALSDILEARGGTSSSVEALDRAVEEIRGLPDEGHRAKRALDALVGAADSLGRRLLLLVDNADLILDRIGEQDWTLREVLSSQPKVTFIGASAAMLETTYEYGRAFYDFFKLHELAALGVDETKRFLLRYSEAQEKPHIREVVENEPARLRTLHTLTGGNPRTLVLLFNIFAHGPDGDVRSDLEQLLDQCTPLYKARFEALPAQLQQVVDALALHWDPVSAGALAGSLRMSTKQVSAQLNRLHQMGVVEKVPYEPTHKTGFQVAERFFNIWYLMRASRRVRRRLAWLVEFLRMFYGQEELRGDVKRQLRMANMDIEYSEQGDLEAAEEAWLQPEKASYRANEVAPESGEAWRSLGLLLAHQGRGDEAESALRKAIVLDSEDPVGRSYVAWSSFVSNRNLEEAESLAREGVELDPRPEFQHTLACILVRNGKRNEATAPAFEFLRTWAAEVPDGLWPEVIVFFREAVGAGKVREAADLLDALDLSERWRPLREALEAIARDSDTYLRRVAPEVREPAEAILKELKEPIEAS
jgi:tetratricopeptide (TPR) repeat protein